MHKKRTLIGLLVSALILTVTAIPAMSTVTVSGFQDDDGNLELDAGQPGNFDWNEFAPTTWTGIAPNRTATDATGGWAFDGNEDWQASTADDAFSGGTKQDNECASVITAKANNKTDLKRVYLASKIINGDTFLMLAWSRIPQNTTSPSANVAFEFNRGETPCPGSAGAAGLVRRSVDTNPDEDIDNSDLLVVYDFLGGDEDPTINIARWVGSGPCEVGSSTPPCWGPYETLSSPTSEAKVNTFGSVVDEVGPAGNDPGETLGTKEFGEAGINLTEAGVFPEVGCVTFGQNYAVSRTSGNSATAQMKDLVGTDFLLTNCGSLKIEKEDSEGNNLAGAKFRVYKDDGDGVAELGGDDVQIKADGTPGTFECETTADGTGNCVYANLLIGDAYWVDETAAPPGYDPDPTGPKLVTITDASQHVVTFVNQPALGDIKVIKEDDAGNLLNNVTFTLVGTSTTGESVNLSCVTGVSNSDGTVPATGQCSFLNVPVGTNYTLDETPPAGYAKDADFPMTVSVTGTLQTFTATNPRQHKVIVIVCHEGTNTLLATDVVNGTSTKISLGTAPAGITEAQLCGLGGASFGGLNHVNKNLTVELGDFDADHTP